MSIRQPKIKELKTELISVMDYYNPSSIEETKTQFVLPQSASQKEKVRNIIVSNALLETLRKIGDTTPNEIEFSATFVKEIKNIMNEYENAISPLLLLVSENGFLSELRSEISKLTTQYYPGIAVIPTELNKNPYGLEYAIMGAFHPYARYKAIEGEVSVENRKKKFDEIIGNIWGLVNGAYVPLPNYPLYRQDTLAAAEIGNYFGLMDILLTYCAQILAIKDMDPNALSDKTESIHSKIIKNTLVGTDFGLLKGVLFDNTTSRAKAPMGSFGLFNFVNTDVGFTNVFRELVADSSLRPGTSPTVSLFDYLNNPQNILKLENIISLRDGFISDTELAEELGINTVATPGINSAEANPLNKDYYKQLKEKTKKYKKDLFDNIKSSIINSEFLAGPPGDMVPGITPENIIQDASGMKDCKWIAIKECLAPALTHQGAKNFASMFSQNSYNPIKDFTGVKKVLGREWYFDSIKKIAKYSAKIQIDKFRENNPAGINFNPQMQANNEEVRRLRQQISENNEKLEIINSTRLHKLEILETINNLNIAVSDDSVYDANPLNYKNLNYLLLSPAPESEGIQPIRAINRNGIEQANTIKNLANKANTNNKNIVNKYYVSNNGNVTVLDNIDSININDNRNYIEIVNLLYSGEVLIDSFIPGNNRQNDKLRLRSFLSGILYEYIISNEGVNTDISGLDYDWNVLVQEIAAANTRINDLQQENIELSDDNFISVLTNISNFYPFPNVISLNENIRASRTVINDFNNNINLDNIIKDDENSPLLVNDTDPLDPGAPMTDTENGPVTQPASRLLEVVNSIMLTSIRNIFSNISTLPNDTDPVLIKNFAYCYFMILGIISRKIVVAGLKFDATIEDIEPFTNRIIDPNNTMFVLLKNETDIINFAKHHDTFSKKYSLTVGLGDNAPEGMNKDGFDYSIEYTEKIYNLITNTIPPAFSVATEASIKKLTAMRNKFAQNLKIGNQNFSIVLNLLDTFLGINNFNDFKLKIDNFTSMKSLIPVLLLSSNKVDYALNLSQFCLHVLSECSFTKIKEFNIANYKIPYNKVSAIGINKKLQELLRELQNDNENNLVKRGLYKTNILQRNLDPNPSSLDVIFSQDSGTFPDSGRKYMQSTPVYGIDSDLLILHGLKIDYNYLINNFTLETPEIKLVFGNNKFIIVNLGKTEMKIFNKNREYRENEKISINQFGEITLSQMRSCILTLLRSEALKIYYYYTTGFVFDPEFCPDPSQSDEKLTSELIGNDPISRIKSLITIFTDKGTDYFEDIVLIPFISDNDQIEEFTSKLILVTD